MYQTNQSKIDWNKFRELESKRHREFFLPMYDMLGYKIVEDIYDDTKVNSYDVVAEIEGVRVTIDEKCRQREYSDLLVEMMQCIRTGRIGWIYKPVDLIFYAAWGSESSMPTSAYVMKRQKLLDFVVDEFENLPEHFSAKGYGLSWNKSVRWENLVHNGIAKRVV